MLLYLDSQRKVGKIFNNIPQGSRLRERQKKTDSVTAYQQIKINAKLQIGKRGQKQS
jgi:hypothetical protein